MTTKKKKLNVIVQENIYKYDVMFSFGETEEDLRKRFKKFGVEEGNLFDNKLKAGQCAQFVNGQVVIRMPQIPVTNEHYGTLQHEIFHAVVYIMTYIGSNLSRDSEEPYAYLLGYLTTKIYEKLQ